MKVLSLFDGISCGMVALERAGIKVDKYYASEIDKYAIKVSQSNYPDIIQLGDVTKWRDWDIDLGDIDLLIGGSPCQGFSFAGKQLNFDDPRSKLFFVYVEILNHIKVLNPNIKFLLENVKMKKQCQDIISKKLGVEPWLINSKDFSPQNRERNYWFNFEISLYSYDLYGKIKLSDILENGIACIVKKQGKDIIKYNPNKSLCLLARDYKRFGNQQMTGKIVDGELQMLSCVEYERLQTLPDNYTTGLSNTQRYKAIGNGWTVDVIAHIFRGLKQ